MSMLALPVLFNASLAYGEAYEEAITKLDSEHYEDRKEAYGILKKWAMENTDRAIPLLYRNTEQATSPELSLRVHQILREIVLNQHFGRPQGFIGIQLLPGVLLIDGENVPVVKVSGVIPESAAAQEGLQAGDIISSLEGKRMTEHELRNARTTASQLFIDKVSKKFKGDQVRLGIYEEGKERELVLTLGERPENLRRSQIEPSEKIKDAYYEKWLQEQKRKQPLKK